MNQKKFLSALRWGLRSLRKEEREQYVASYQELLSDMVENGMSQEEAVNAQGDVKQIAKEILENAPESARRKNRTGVLLVTLSGILVLITLAELLIAQFFRSLDAVGSVGVIGGADGPTAIFVTTATYEGINPLHLLTLISIGITVGYFLWKRWKKRG